MTQAPRSINAAMGEKFVRTLWSTARHKAIYGGRGSAKSWSVATYLTILSGQERRKIVCGRQFQNSIRDSSKGLIEKVITRHGLNQHFHITDQTIIHRSTKSEFLFAGLERNIESIRSLEGAEIVWVEEARTIKSKSMEVLLPTIREPGSTLIWTWNPELPDDPVDAYFRHGQPPPRSIVTFVDYTDNPYFYQTELPHEMEVLRRGNYERYKHVWLGGYDEKHQSKVFSGTRTGRMVIPEDCPARYGMDFGFGSDPAFVVKVYVNENRRQIYIAEEATGRVAMDELPQLVDAVVESRSDLIIADSSQPGTIEFLNRRGFNLVGAKKGPGSVKSGINFLNGYDIIIDPNCENMREEARLYSWMTESRTGKILNTPVDANNHGWDATRYAVEDLSLEGGDGQHDPDGGVIQLKWK